MIDKNYEGSNPLLRLFLILVIAATAMPAMSAAETVIPSPFAATYTVTFRGLHAGEMQSVLSPRATDEFLYETRVKPSFLAKVFVSSNAREFSLMRIDEGGVRPLFWMTEDGKPGVKKDGALEFDWNQEQVDGVVEGELVELPTEPKLQDRLSIQIAVITALLRAEEPGVIPLIDQDKIKHYSYTRAGTGMITTAMGEFEAVVYESTRRGSSRVSRFWHAPALDFIPVRAEQVRKGKIETVMELVELERG